MKRLPSLTGSVLLGALLIAAVLALPLPAAEAVSMAQPGSQGWLADGQEPARAAPAQPELAVASLPPVLTDDFEPKADRWTVQAGRWSVIPDDTNVYNQISTTVTARSVVSTETTFGWADYVVQSKVKLVSVANTSSSYAMLMARYQDSKNYYFMTVRPNEKIEIKKYVNGSSGGTCSTGAGCTVASLPYSITVGTWYTAAFEVSGTSLRAFIDGTPLITATDVYTPFVSGAFGLGTATANASFDDVLVSGVPVALPSPFDAAVIPPSFSDDFEPKADRWTVQAGIWSVIPDDTYVYNQISTTVTARSVISTETAFGWKDYSVQSRVKLVSVASTSSSYAMLMARYQDSKNYYFMTVRPNEKVEIKKYVNGSSSSGCPTGGGCTLGTQPISITVGTWYTAKFEVNGSSLRAFLDGTALLTVTDVYTPFVAGTLGLGTATASASFDDVVVSDIPATLTISKTGAGSGLVSSVPTGITCGGTCSADFVQGTVVTLTATADPGSSFGGWGGACLGPASAVTPTDQCTVQMTAAKDVTATFNKYFAFLPVVVRNE